MIDNVTLDGIRTTAEYDLISLYDQLGDVDDPADNNSPFQYANASCKYYEADDLTKLTAVINDPLSFFHLNCRGLSANWESFKNLLCDLHETSFSFDVIGINALITFLSKNNILYKHQYGFRPKHSTIHPIIHLLNHCASKSSNIDPEMSLAVLCDLSKAFDVIDHGILLTKTEQLWYSWYSKRLV